MGRGLADDIGENRTQGTERGGMSSSAAKMAALHVAVVAEGILVLPTTFAEASTSAKATVDKSAVRMWECCQLATGDVSVHLTLPTDVVSGQSA